MRKRCKLKYLCINIPKHETLTFREAYFCIFNIFVKKVEKKMKKKMKKRPVTLVPRFLSLPKEANQSPPRLQIVCEVKIVFRTKYFDIQRLAKEQGVPPVFNGHMRGKGARRVKLRG